MLTAKRIKSKHGSKAESEMFLRSETNAKFRLRLITGATGSFFWRNKFSRRRG